MTEEEQKELRRISEKKNRITYLFYFASLSDSNRQAETAELFEEVIAEWRKYKFH